MRHSVCVGLYLGFVLCAPEIIRAQAVSGGISGTVNDATGGVVLHATVTARNTATNVETRAETTAAGYYSIVHLVPSTYSVTVVAPGFRRFSADNVEVNVDSIVRLDVQLTVGDMASEVTVQGGAPLLQSEKTELSAVITGRLVQELPTLGRNMSRLVGILPGAVPNTSQLEYHVENMVEDFRVGINGQIWGNNNRQIDGIDNNETIQGSAIIVPTADSVDEVKVTTNNYDAEFGQVAGAVIQTVTKSGSNALHGSVFEYLRNSETFSRNPFTELAGPSPFKWNQFGGSLGGPVRKEKLFFFGDYQGTRQRLGSGLQSTVPLGAFRSGDFGSLSRNLIFDPSTGDANGRGRQQFPNNVIPASRINPTAAKLFALLPAPTDPSRTDQNYTRTDVTRIGTNQATGRMDYLYSPNTRLFGRYTFFGSTLDVPVLYGDVAGGPAFSFNGFKDATTRSQNLAFNYQRTITPTFLTEARFGFSRFRAYGELRDSQLKTSDQVGLPGINTGDVLTGGLPGFSIGGPVGAFNFGDPASAPFSEIEQNIQFVSNWTKISSSHSFKWGADVRPARLKRFAQNGRGALNFDQNLSGSADLAGTGLGMASFLLGGVQSFSRSLKVDRANEVQTRMGFFFSDQWRISRKLTLNYGVRWEVFTQVGGDTPGGITNLDFTTGEVLFNDVGSVNHSAGIQPYYGNLAPRLGIAYMLRPKTVIRTGFGRSYAINVFGSNFGTMSQQWPNTAAQDLTAPTFFTSVFRLDQGPPDASALPKPPASGRLLLPRGVGFIGFSVNNKFDYLDAWNFAVQQQIGNEIALEIAYVGNVGRRIFWNENPNLAIPGPGAADPRRPYFARLGWNQNPTLRSHLGRSGYNALQTKIDKRFSKGYSLLASFTWQNGMDFGTNGAQNKFDWRSDHSPMDNDRKFYLTISHTWELPLHAKGPARHLVEGWSFSGISLFASGIPFTPILGNTASYNSPGVTLRPDRLQSGAVSSPTRDRWFDKSAFATPPLYTYGNSGRNILRGPGLANLDWAIGKNFHISESKLLKFRWEVFNAFNRTNLANPVNTIDSSTAGRIFSLFPGYNMRRMQFGLHLVW
jgi:carboxypeptidase family protein